MIIYAIFLIIVLILYVVLAALFRNACLNDRRIITCETDKDCSKEDLHITRSALSAKYICATQNKVCVAPRDTT
jgi:hypothetical protein